MLSKAQRRAFEDKVYPDPNSGCFIFAGGCDRHGYGRFPVGRTPAGNKKYAFAHRVAFELEHGRVPVGHLLHSCDTPCCVNPLHLREGNPSANLRDMQRRERGRKSALGLPYGVQPQPQLWGGGWTARITVSNQRYYLGKFDSVEEAANAAVTARNRLLKGESL